MFTTKEVNNNPGNVPIEVLISFARRFDKNTTRTAKGCLEWKSIGASGYGIYRTSAGSGDGSTKNYMAHRLSSQLFNDDFKPGNVCMHLCDNKECVDHNHVKQGTQSENMLDYYRTKRGERVPLSSN